jgi:invasion protein IalB
MARINLGVLAVAILGGGILILGALALFYFNRAEIIAAVDLPEPGFVGTTTYGDWDLICAPRAEMAPAPITFDQPDSISSESAALESACRLRHDVVAQPAEDGAPPHVILAVQLSLVGPSERPALMLRLPATLTEGDMVVLRTRGEFAVETLARDCSAEECIAASTLSEEEWEQLVEADSLQAVFRVDGVQLVSVDISTDGLPEVQAALKAAQAPKPPIAESPTEAPQMTEPSMTEPSTTRAP